MRLRKAEERDYRAFVRLFPELAIDDPLPSEDVFRREIAPSALFAEIDEQVAGFVSWIAMADNCHLRILITAPEMRRRGVGRALMAEVRNVALAAGCRTWTLNVLPSNRAAIALYASMGLARVFASKSLRLPWAAVEAMPASEHLPRPLEEGDDVRIGEALEISPALLALRRSQLGRKLLVLEIAGEPVAACAFDPAFPGTQPFRAKTILHAMALLRALRPFALPEHDHLHLMLDGNEAVAADLVARGATVRFDTMFMRGTLA